MPQLDQVSACPGCGEPLEQDDRFCGVCGTRLRGDDRADDSRDAQAPDADDPTIAVRTPTEPDFPLPPPQQRPEPDHRDHEEPPPATPVVPPLVPPGSFGPPTAPPAPPATPPVAPPAGPPAPPEPPKPPVAPPPAATEPQARPRLPALDPRTPQPPTGSTPGSTPGSAPGPHPGGPASGAAPRGRRPGATDPRTHDAGPPAPQPSAVPCSVCGTGRVAADGYCEECGHAQPGERDHVERALGGVAAVSDLGLRHHRNEDAFAVSATALPDGSPAVVAVVCDGVSSSSRPDDASARAAEAAQESLLRALPRGVTGQQAMHDALLDAAQAVADLADDTERGPAQNAPACTIVSAVTANGTLTVGWVGDSRAYWVPLDDEGAPARLTEDDSWAAQMVAAGLLSEAEAMADHRAHAITAWLGADAQEIAPHTASFKPDRPGVVIICTDGLWNYAESAEEMARLVPVDARTAPLTAARRLVTFALESGGHDNVTVALIPFPVVDDRAGRA